MADLVLDKNNRFGDFVDSSGAATQVKLDAAGNMPVNVEVALTAGDVEIGAVELKDATTEARCTISTTEGLLVNLGANNDVTATLANSAIVDCNGSNVTIDNAASSAAVNVQDGGNALTIDFAGVTPQLDDTDKIGVSLYGKGTNAGDTPVLVDSDGHTQVDVLSEVVGSAVSTLIDVTLDNDPTTFTSAATDISEYDKVTFLTTYDETEHIGEIETFTRTNGGTGYAVSDVLTVVEGTGAAGTITVDSVDGTEGAILGYTMTNGGSGYEVNDILTLAQAGGSEAAGTVIVDTINDGTVLTSHLGDAGTGYLVAAAQDDSGTGNDDFTCSIDTIHDGEVLTYTLTTPGLGYNTGAYSTTAAPAGGTGFVGNITAVGTALSAVFTLTGSMDDATYVTIPFLDTAGGATPQTSETISADGSYLCWLPEGFTMPYLKATITGAATDINDTIAIKTVIAAKK